MNTTTLPATKTNVRYSKKRQAILELLQNTTTHPSAEWIFQQLKPVYPDLSLGTIYRNLIFFQDHGDLISVGVVNGQERFDATTCPHAHFICQHCHAVYDLHDLNTDTSQEVEVEKEYGFRVEKQELTFYGTCTECLQVEENL